MTFRIWQLFIVCIPLLYITSTVIAVQYHPTMIKEPPYEKLYLVAENQDEPDISFTLECEADGNPEPVYKWIKNGQQFDYESYNKRILKQPRRGTLLFIKPDDVDEGIYRCVAENIHGRAVSNPVFLRKVEKPSYEPDRQNTSPSTIIGLRGQTVTLNCIYGGTPMPIIYWRKKGGSFSSLRYQFEQNSRTLKISPVTYYDEATYECSAINGNGSTDSHEMTVIVQAAPYWIESPNNTNAVEGESVKFKCHTDGIPIPKLQWFVNGKPIDTIPNPRRKVQENVLHIENLVKSDTADYQCNASNIHGYVFHNFYLNILEKPSYEPDRQNTSPSNFIGFRGQTVTLNCIYDDYNGIPLGGIRWRKKGGYLSSHRYQFEQNRRTLKISPVTYDDEATYVCIVHNRNGSIHRHAMTVTVHDVPDPPRITEIKCNGLSAVLEWQPEGYSRIPILNYIIQYNTSFSSDSWINAFETVLASNTQVTLSMSPWANYTFRVIARSKIGSGLPSAPSDKCETPPDVPYKNPDKVEGYGTEPNNLIISWSTMPLIDHNAPGFYYRVYWKRNDLIDAMWEYEEITNWKQNQHILYNQPTFRPYQIKVRAHNQIGQSTVMPAEIIGYSGEDVPEEAPKNFHLVHIKDARSALMAWNHVPKHSVRGHFKGYKIQVWTSEEGEEHMREQIVAPEKNESLINILRPNSNNKAVIFVFNERYTGPRSEVIQFYTPEEEHELPLESSSNLDLIENNTDASILKSPENKNEINKEFMINCMNALKNNSVITPIEKYQAIGINVAVKLEKMNSTQRLYAEELINIILLKGLNGRLTAETDKLKFSK